MDNLATKKPSRRPGTNDTDNTIMIRRLMQVLEERTEPMSRMELVRILNIDDRTIRELISYARTKGVPICSASDRKGYWLGDEYDVARLVSEYRGRANTLQEVANALEREAMKRVREKREEQQLCMEGFEEWQRN